MEENQHKQEEVIIKVENSTTVATYCNLNFYA